MKKSPAPTVPDRGILSRRGTAIAKTKEHNPVRHKKSPATPLTAHPKKAWAVTPEIKKFVSDNLHDAENKPALYPVPIRTYHDFNEAKNTLMGRSLYMAWRLFTILAEEKMTALGYPGYRYTYPAVLGQIDENGIRSITIARRLGLTKQAMTNVVKELEAEGLLYSEPDAADKRARTLFLTQAGRDMLVHIGQCNQDIAQQLADAMGMVQFESAMQGLHALGREYLKLIHPSIDE